MNIAWQTWVVAALSLAAFAIGLVASNTQQLGVTAPWITIVVIPTALTALTLAANQLKTVGADVAK